MTHIELPQQETGWQRRASAEAELANMLTSREVFGAPDYLNSFSNTI